MKRKIVVWVITVGVIFLLGGCVGKEKTYSLVFSTNGGTPIATHTFKNSFNLNDLHEFTTTKDGYDFESWHLDSSLSSESLAKGTIKQSTILYAKWKEAILEEDMYYTITFMQDEHVLYETQVLENALPIYQGVNPTKEQTPSHTYTFIGWDKEISLATKDETYIAAFSPNIREYNVSFYDENNTLIKVEKVPYGGDAIGLSAPLKAGHTFVSWSGLLTNITNNISVYPIYDINVYTVTFQHEDGSVLFEDFSVPYGTVPTYVGNTPTKEGSDTVSYTFIGWTPELVAITGNAFYTAVFREVNKEVIDASLFNKAFNADIYGWFPTLKTANYQIESYQYDVYTGVYVYLYDWSETDYLAYIDSLDHNFDYDDISDEWVLEESFLDELRILLYLDETVEEPMYVLYVYANHWFNKDHVNMIMGFDIWSLLPEVEITKYDIEDGSNEDEYGLYLTIYNWAHYDALAYDTKLQSLFSIDPVEEIYVISNSYVGVFYDDTEDEAVYGIMMYRYIDDPLPSQQEEGTYFSFNMQEVTSLGNENYASNTDVLLLFSGSSGLVNIYGSQLMNVTGSFASGLSKGITFASNTKTAGSKAVLEFDSLGNLISSMAFTMVAEENFQSKITGAYIEVYDNGSWVKKTDFYYQIKKESTEITINNIDASRFRLIFNGSGEDANSGRFMIHEVILYDKEEEVKTYEEILLFLANQFKDLNFPNYLVDISDIEDLSISSSISNTYTIKGNYQGTQANSWIGDFNERLLINGWVLEDFAYKYILPTYDYQVSASITDGTFHLTIQKKAHKEEASAPLKLNYFESINDYQLKNYDASGLPSKGEVDVLVVPIEIKGYAFPSGYLQDLETVFNGESMDTGYHSVTSYYELSSYGHLDLSFDISPKYTTTNGKSHYESYGDLGDQIIILEALNYLDAFVDFTKYDANEDSIIDSVIFIYSVNYGGADTWWAWVYIPEEDLELNVSDLDGMQFMYYMWASYHFMFDELTEGVTYNAETYIHEMGHLFGLSDYYASDKDFGVMGGFDMMDYNIGDHGPFNKLILGWIEPLYAFSGLYEVTLDAYTKYEPSLNQVLIIPKDPHSFDDIYGYSEYIMLMFYKPEGLYDAHLEYYGSLEDPGIVIYHINATPSTTGDHWDHFMYENYSASNFSLISILEADKNNSLPGNVAISSSDILRSGTLDLSHYTWFDGTKMTIGITLLNAVSLLDQDILFRVDIY